MCVWKDFVETADPIDPFNPINNKQVNKPTFPYMETNESANLYIKS